jgi:AAA15 family ATPase/GTPase
MTRFFRLFNKKNKNTFIDELDKLHNELLSSEERKVIIEKIKKKQVELAKELIERK